MGRPVICFLKGIYDKTSLMERYSPHDRGEVLNPVIGNLWIASSFGDIDRNKGRVIKELEDYRKSLPHRAQAMIALREGVIGIPLFIYVPHVKHGSEIYRRSRKINVFDNEQDCLQIEIPQMPLKFNLKELRRPWESDIVLYAHLNPNSGHGIYTLSHFFDGFVTNPRRFLGVRMKQPSLF